MPRTFCIGDIHGHYDQLMDLMQKLETDHGLDLTKDILVQLGDLVDGGPKTQEVLDWAIDLKTKYPKNFIPLFGNHESLLLDALSEKKPIYGSYYHWFNQGGKETLNSFVPEGDFSDYEKSIMQPEDLIKEKYLNFINDLDLYYENDDYFFVHAGLYPNRSIEAHKEAVGSFHPVLMTEGSMDYDMIWIREPFLSATYDWGKKIIFGHTMFPYREHEGVNEKGEYMAEAGYPLIHHNKIGIDTMALKFNPQRFEGRLTALILPEEELVHSEFS